MPNPFTVTLRCLNIGGSPATKVSGTITLPHDVVFADSGETPAKPFIPSTIDVYQGGATPQLSWNLRYTGRPRKDSRLVFHCVLTGADTASQPLWDKPCEVAVGVHKARIPVPAPTCTAPDSLHYIDLMDDYDPNPFTVSLDCPNFGDIVGMNATATLTLPDGVVFVDQNETVCKAFNPPTLPVYQGGIAPRVSWLVRYTQRPDHATILPFKILVGCTTPSGLPVDSAKCESFVRAGIAPAVLSPRITWIGPLNGCEGDTVTLEATDGYASYRWNNGATSRSIRVVSSGGYFVTVKDETGRQGTSRTITVVMSPIPTAKLVPSGIREFCEGEVVSIDAGAGHASYRWNTGDTMRTLRVTTSGAWFVTVASAEGCSGTSDTLTTVMIPGPPMPTIGQSGGTLFTQTAFRYQWYRNGMPIPGAVDRTLTVTQIGSFTVMVTNEKGCSRLSQPFSFTTIPVEDIPAASAWSLDLHPDPAGDAIFVTVRHLAASTCTVQLLDHIGRVLEWKDVVRSGDTFPVSFELASRPSGVYFISVMSEGRSLVKRFVKMR
jgi:hypothetical protein